MAYSRTSNSSKTINYLNRDFDDFKKSLLNLAEVYFPDTYTDFSEASPGTMFIEMASYVGDVLSFYTDAQIQEVFLQYAQERENLFALAYNLGYRPVVTNPSSVILDIYQELPVNASYEPDWNYALKIAKNSVFLPNNNSGISFLTQDAVNFGFSSSFDPTEVTVLTVVNNKPDSYLLKKQVKAISATIKTKTYSIGAAEKFKTLTLEDSNIIGIQSIIDSDGNLWNEVPYLAQETIFEEVPNTGANDPTLNQYNSQTPYLLKTKKVPKRFITRFKSDRSLLIQFGSGISSGDDEDILPDPNNVGLGIRDGRTLLDFSFDPSNFLYSKAYGEVPSDTTLTVTYLVGGGVNSNFPANSINRVGTLLTSPTSPGLNSGQYNEVISSVRCNNPQPALGGGPGDTATDIRLNAVANFNSQQRTVTKEDYIFRTLAMPNQFGKVAKTYIIQDNQISLETNKRIANPNALNLYTLGYDINQKLATLSLATKTNLATYLDQYRLMTDSINIKDAYVINIGIEFDITVNPNFSNESVLLACNNALQRFFNVIRWQINQPIILGDINGLLYNIDGVQNVNSINIVNKVGESNGYSKYKYDIELATKDGVIYPSQDPSIFELKYPTRDIKGRVKTI
jgi:hypothetical protein